MRIKFNALLIILFVIISIRVFLTFRVALAEESFDTVHYLSYIIEAAKGSYLTQFNVDGLARTFLSSTDDFSSYFYLLAGLYNLIQGLKVQLGFNVLSITMPEVIWISTILYYVLSSSFVIFLIKYFQIKSRLIQLGLILITQFYFGSMYFNSVFAIYGHTFRTLISGFIVFALFEMLKKETLDLKETLLLMLSVSALLGVSSSGFYIAIFALYTFTMVIIWKRKLSNHELSYFFLIFLPLVMFALNHFYLSGLLNVKHVGFVALAYLLIWIITYHLKYNLHSIYKLIGLFLVPALIFFLSFRINQTTHNWLDFFIQRSYTDMVYDYLSLSDIRHVLFNGILWVSIILYVFKGKSNFKYYVLIIFALFLNPLTYPFVTKYLNYDLVYQRGYDAIFNPFTVVLFVNHTMQLISKRKVMNILLTMIIAYLAFYESTHLYHFYFKPEDNFNGYKRLPQDQVEVMEMLNTKVVLEKYELATIVSQIPSIKGFVSNIYNIIDFDSYRSTDRYSGKLVPSYSPIWNIFFPREYYGQPVFSDEPDYENTCTYLIDGKVDFVLVDSTQYYMKDGNYVPLYMKVRDCAKEVYRNDRYILYQFYWR